MLDPGQKFRGQEPEKLIKVFRRVRLLPSFLTLIDHAKITLQARAKYPYLTRKRFPQDWAVSEISMNYLRGRRKYLVSKGLLPRNPVYFHMVGPKQRAREAARAAKESNPDPETDEDDEEEDHEMDEDDDESPIVDEAPSEGEDD